MIQKPVLLASILLLSVATPASAQATEVTPKPRGPATVLLLAPPSESFVRELADRDLDVRAVGAKAASAKTLREDPAPLTAIREGGSDFVVLTGHPTFGKTLLIDGESRVGDPSDFLHHGRLLLEEVRRAGARPILLVPPAGPGAPAEDRQAVEWAHHRLAREAGALLAPVADAFERTRRRRPDLALFDPHGASWSPLGAHLAASVVEIAVTGRMPVANDGPDDARKQDDPLPGEVRRLLTRVAWASSRELAASGGSRDIPAPPFPPVPTVARGEPLDRGAIRGTWRGPLRLYPWPATLELDIREGAGGLRIDGRVRFSGERPDLGFEAVDARLGDRVLSFSNPADLAEGRTRYRLVARAGRLTGVAELTTEGGGVYSIGGFELERVERPPAAGQP